MVKKVLQGTSLGDEDDCDEQAWLIPAISILTRSWFRMEDMTELVNGTFIEDMSTLLSSCAEGKNLKTFFEIDKEFEIMMTVVKSNFWNPWNPCTTIFLKRGLTTFFRFQLFPLSTSMELVNLVTSNSVKRQLYWHMEKTDSDGGWSCVPCLITKGHTSTKCLWKDVVFGWQPSPLPSYQYFGTFLQECLLREYMTLHTTYPLQLTTVRTCTLITLGCHSNESWPKGNLEYLNLGFNYEYLNLEFNS